MRNVTVQVRIFTEPKERLEGGIELAVRIEEKIREQKP